MCQITISNLNDQALNKKLFLIMGTLGSGVHKDGWGIADKDGTAWKCELPMMYTSDAGQILRTSLKAKHGMLLGHIRQASPKVPVETRNAHPFWNEEIVFVHNGKLVPKKESDFVMEEEVDDTDINGKLILTTSGVVKKKKVSVSDSLIFFQKFVENWEKEKVTNKDQTSCFVNTLKATMELFTGKFAMVFIINKTFYVVRGKTADLYISYIKENSSKDSKTLGWAINTSKEILSGSLLLLSNLQQLEGKPELHFTFPEILKEETMFEAETTGLKILGEIKENSAPVAATSYGKEWRGATNFTGEGANGKVDTTKLGENEKYYFETWEFMNSYSLGVQDIQFLFFKLYGVSLEETTSEMLKHFCRRVIPSIASRVKKDIRRALRKSLSELPVGLFRYSPEYAYPWFLNNKSDQQKFLKYVQESMKVDKK